MTPRAWVTIAHGIKYSNMDSDLDTQKYEKLCFIFTSTYKNSLVNGCQ
jgi:hypothetical protein